MTPVQPVSETPPTMENHLTCWWTVKQMFPPWSVIADFNLFFCLKGTFFSSSRTEQFSNTAMPARRDTGRTVTHLLSPFLFLLSTRLQSARWHAHTHTHTQIGWIAGKQMRKEFPVEPRLKKGAQTGLTAPEVQSATTNYNTWGNTTVRIKWQDQRSESVPRCRLSSTFNVLTFLKTGLALCNVALYKYKLNY